MRVPFVDVLGALSDPTLPLTVPEYSEWGNPSAPGSEGARAAAYIAAYCPLQNVPASESAPPHILATASTLDPRVPHESVTAYIERWRHAAGIGSVDEQTMDGNNRSAASTARRAIKPNAPAASYSPLLVCDVDDSAGHEGSPDTELRHDALADEQAFLHAALGLTISAN
jgi:protease II